MESRAGGIRPAINTVILGMCCSLSVLENHKRSKQEPSTGGDAGPGSFSRTELPTGTSDAPTPLDRFSLQPQAHGLIVTNTGHTLFCFGPVAGAFPTCHSLDLLLGYGDWHSQEGLCIQG